MMYYKFSLKIAIFIAFLSLSGFSQADLIFEFTEDPDNLPVLPLKPGDTLNLIVTNKAPVTHQLTFSAENGEIIGTPTADVMSNASHSLAVKVNSFGNVQVCASSGNKINKILSQPYLSSLRMATFNLSFDRNTFQDLVRQMEISHDEQETLIEQYDSGALDNDKPRKELAKKVIQIRNVAEIIQRENPDIIMLAEFNNDGQNTNDTRAIEGFQTNYLDYSHNNVRPVTFEHRKTFGTNTGLLSPYDLNNDGQIALPNDAWGFGNYHGQYAFAVFSKYPFDEGMRTFQNFKWKDIPEAKNPVIVECDDPTKIPAGKQCGDKWYSDDAWDNFPISSKNHIDLPVLVPTENDQEKTVHLLLSHPTPPIFDTVARTNYWRNSFELQIWHDYIHGKNYLIDDQGKQGGLTKDALFIIAGDMNADSEVGDGDRDTIKRLINDTLVNTSATTGKMVPTSNGGPEFLRSSDAERNQDRPNPQVITSDAGLQLDHIIPSKGLKILGSKVFWPANNEPGRYLVYDKELGFSKGVSSDHRLVRLDFYIPN